MNRFNLRSLKQFWAIARLYWLGEDKGRALGLLSLLVGGLVAYTWLSVILNQKEGQIFSDIVALLSNLTTEQKESLGVFSLLFQPELRKLRQTILTFLLVLVVYVPLFAGFRYLRDILGLYWRRWLTHHYLDHYFENRAFYDLTSDDQIDNPDQRIAEDIRAFTGYSLTFLLVFAQAIFQIFAFSTVLWSISKTLVVFLVIYAMLGNLTTVGFFGRILVKLNFNQLKKEANFRFGLVRVRENAESIAFYHGEDQEADQAKNFFAVVFQNLKSLVLWRELNLGMFIYTYQFLPGIIPAIIILPGILRGELEVGKLREADGAFFRVFSSLNEIVSNFETLTLFTAGIGRLHAFEEYFKQTRTARRNQQAEARTIDIVEDSRLAVQHLTLQTPNYRRTLFENLSLDLEPGQGLLVIGVSGCGKSSLLRAIAGLWNSGTGAIVRPPMDEILFLPQRPYMILGSLRSQLLYPSTDISLPESELHEVMAAVNLPDLVERFGGLDVEQDWGDVLSFGEQQRIAFARLLVTKPRYAILDEATSALDVKNEAALYAQLAKSNITYISVGHRPTLVQYHHQILELSEQDGWQLRPAPSVNS